MNYQHILIAFLVGLASPAVVTEALCPAGFAIPTENDFGSRSLQAGGSDCDDYFAKFASSSGGPSIPFTSCDNLIEQHPCGSKIEPAGNLEVNSVCAKTCNACSSGDDQAFPYTVTYAPFSPDSHHMVFTVEEDTIQVVSTVPHDTDYIGLITAGLDVEMSATYVFHFSSREDENGEIIYTVEKATYYSVSYFGPTPNYVEEKASRDGTGVMGCTEDIYEATGNGTFCNYDGDNMDLIVLLPHGTTVFSGVSASSTDAMDIVSVAQDESNIKVTWKVPRTTTLSSRDLFVRYVEKPTWFDGTYYAGGDLEYHGPYYRASGKIALIPTDENEEEGVSDVVPSSSPSAALTIMAPPVDEEDDGVLDVVPSPGPSAPTTITPSVDNSSSAASLSRRWTGFPGLVLIVSLSSLVLFVLS